MKILLILCFTFLLVVEKKDSSSLRKTPHCDDCYLGVVKFPKLMFPKSEKNSTIQNFIDSQSEYDILYFDITLKENYYLTNILRVSYDNHVLMIEKNKDGCLDYKINIESTPLRNYILGLTEKADTKFYSQFCEEWGNTDHFFMIKAKGKITFRIYSKLSRWTDMKEKNKNKIGNSIKLVEYLLDVDKKIQSHLIKLKIDIPPN
jgi:hypothetical protein